MPDFQAQGAAIAAKYAALGPPAGLDAIRQSTAAIPNVIKKTPMVLVFPDQGKVQGIGNGTRQMGHDWLVRFYLRETIDLARDMVALESWLTLLLDAHSTAISLGGLVTATRTMSWRIGVMPFATALFAGIQLGVHVVTVESWSPTP